MIKEVEDGDGIETRSFRPTVWGTPTAGQSPATDIVAVSLVDTPRQHTGHSVPSRFDKGLFRVQAHLGLPAPYSPYTATAVASGVGSEQ